MRMFEIQLLLFVLVKYSEEYCDVFTVGQYYNFKFKCFNSDNREILHEIIAKTPQ